MKDNPTEADLKRQHKEIVESRLLRDELLKLEAYYTAAITQIDLAYERCGKLKHLRDAKENVKQMDGLIRSGPLHKLRNIQLAVDRKSGYT